MGLNKALGYLDRGSSGYGQRGATVVSVTK